jgi:hypothetical protein
LSKISKSIAVTEAVIKKPEPCELCKDKKELGLMNDGESFRWKFNYCPMCGRRLAEGGAISPNSGGDRAEIEITSVFDVKSSADCDHYD